MNDLPLPDADALAHSDRLSGMIRGEIAASGGSVPFSRFMERCLYTPGLGYYSAGATKFGQAGDFVTAPEIGPLFASAVSEAVAPVLQQLGPDACFLEIGGGSGAFAEVMLKRLLALDAMPARYWILEPSADLRERQRERLGRRLIPPVFDCVEWLDTPPAETWNGVVFANEVIDALPTPRFTLREGEVFEEHVALDGEGRFVATDRPADPLLAAAVRHVERSRDVLFEDGYRSELLPQLPYWVQAVIGKLDAGALLFCDYGYPRKEYYLEQRDGGTTRAFYRHRMHNDVYRWPGLQDITASVDFTALAEAGTSAGFALSGYATQAGFLIGNGLMDRLGEAEARAPDDATVMRLRNEFKKLTLPNEMGERFQFMGFARDCNFGAAFLSGDLTWRL
ncbi:MAG: SAM-dependent methyltransferase [Pseudoxanthomonas sp.]|jgi:SAM-dependent MidA family methyltransferase